MAVLRPYTLQDLFQNLAGAINSNTDTTTQFEVVDNFVNDAETLLINVSGSPPTLTTATDYPVNVSGDYPISYWRLADAATGTAFDSNQNLFSIYPRISSTSMTSVTQAVTGFLANSTASQFTATTSKIVFPNNASLQITADLTIEFLVKFSSLGSSGNSHSLISKEGGTQGSGEFALYLFNNAGVGSLVYGQASGSPSAGSLATATLYHIAVVRTASNNTVTFYVNGTSAGSGSYVTPSTTTNNVTLGSALYDSPLMTLEEVAIYRKALTSAQVTQHYGWLTASNATARAFNGAATPYGLLLYPGYGAPTSETYSNPATQWGTFQWK